MSAIGWQAAYIVPGIVAVATGVAYLIYLRLRPKKKIQ